MLYLISGNGEPNFGDELIVLSWIKFYRQNGYAGPIFVDCKSGAGARRLHPATANVQYGRFLKAMAVGKDGTVADHIQSGRAVVNYVLGAASVDDPRKAINRIRSVAQDDQPSIDLASIKLVHLVGGGYINGAWTNSFSLVGAASQMGKMLGCPVVASGLGVAPLDNLTKQDVLELERAIETFEMFEVRDAKSYASLTSFCHGEKITSGLDDCFLDEVKVKTRFSGRSLHLCLFGRHAAGDDGLSLFKRIQEFGGQFDRVVAWRCNIADEEACARAAVFFPSLKRMYNRALLYDGLPFGSDDYMITSRFHPHLLGARAGIDGSFLVQSDFYDSKHRSVSELGSRFKLYSSGNGFERSTAASIMPSYEAQRIQTKQAVGARVVSLIH